MLNCYEFVNADNIAHGLSPFNVEKVAFEAGRIMLTRIDELLHEGVDFAIETTLSTRSYVSLVKDAQARNYHVTLLYVWLESEEVAIERVAMRVAEGGHHIPEPIIRRRYRRGISNLFKLYLDLVDAWVLVNNTQGMLERIAYGEKSVVQNLESAYIWSQLKSIADGNSQ